MYGKIGIVYQDFVKYEFTLKENLLLGNFILTEDEINKNVRSIMNQGILSFGEKLQHDLDTQLGTQFDKGVQLSGGEWQQVAFTRAVMKKSDILILDEPSSGLDGEIIEDNTIERLMAYDSYYKYMLSKTIINEKNVKIEV